MVPEAFVVAPVFIGHRFAPVALSILFASAFVNGKG